VNGYAKVFASLFDGSLRGQSDEILVFVYLLCNATATGASEVHRDKISDDTGLSRARVNRAISALEAADPESRTPDEEGRRIVPLDGRGWGWRIVNHKKYRELCGDGRYAALAAKRMQKLREKQSVTQRYATDVTVAQQHASASASASVTEGGVGETRWAEIPDWLTFWEYCRQIGLGAEWWAKDKFLAACQGNWEKQRNWKAYVTRIKVWWEEAGRPFNPPKPKGFERQEPSPKPVNREVFECAGYKWDRNGPGPQASDFPRSRSPQADADCFRAEWDKWLKATA